MNGDAEEQRHRSELETGVEIRSNLQLSISPYFFSSSPPTAFSPSLPPAMAVEI